MLTRKANAPTRPRDVVMSRAGRCAGPARAVRLNRRRFFQLGSLGLFGHGLLDVLASRGEASQRPSGSRRSARACILLFQTGGPYQCDTFDPKPHAPEEIRGPYKAVATSVPNMRVTEALPRLARHADKYAILRGVHHTIRCHNPAIYCSLVGREATEPLAVSSNTAARRTDHPHYASVLDRLRSGGASMPHHVIIPDVTSNGPSKSPGLLAGYLGAAYDPFVLGSDPNDPGYRADAVGLPPDVNPTRLGGRRTLLRQLDGQQRLLENGRGLEALDTFHRRAFALLTSARTKQAFDLAREPARLRDRYGRHTAGQGTLLARRLVEAGVPFVTVFSHTNLDKDSWDTHTKHNERSRELLPPADQSFSALLEDLAERGLLGEVLVVWLGEFGRTPRMGVQVSNNSNNAGGRDHWCNCYSVALAGGGVRGGQVVGSSDFSGGYPKERPVHISELAATIYHALGIDPRAVVHDIQGQPHLICDGNPVSELF